MWLFILLFQCLTQKIVLTNSLENEQTNKTQKQMFDEVIKNISLANQILQELIGNYRKLQNIYESEELSKSRSSDFEVEAAPLWSPVEKKQVRSNQNQIMLAGTAMIVDGSVDDTETTKAIPSRAKSIYASGKLIPTSMESSDYDMESIDTSEEIAIETPKSTKPTNSIRILKLEPMQGKNTKTRFDIKYKANNLGPNPNETKGRDNSRRIEKVVYTESFFPDKIKTKPLQSHSEKAFKHPNKELSLFLAQNRNKIKRDVITAFARNLRDNAQKRQILRDSYGESCIYVAVRKCFKALKSVLKHVCPRRYCSSKLKSYFKTNSKTACINEFDYKKSEPTTLTPTNRRAFKKGSKDKKLMNISRNSYLDTCIPSMVTSNLTLRDIPKAQQQKFNILRDKYEKRCKRLSSKKCNSACVHTYQEACAAYKCSKEKKKSFKKNCKRDCKSAYNVYKESSSDSSDSGSDSDSDEDSSEK